MKRTTYKQRRFLLLCLLAAILPFAALSAQDKKALDLKPLNQKPLDAEQVRTTLAKYGGEIAQLPGLLPAGWKITYMVEGICDTTSNDSLKVFGSPLIALHLASDTSGRMLYLRFYPASVYRKITPVHSYLNMTRSFNGYMYPEEFLLGTRYCVFVAGSTRVILDKGIRMPAHQEQMAYKPMLTCLYRLFPYQ